MHITLSDIEGFLSRFWDPNNWLGILFWAVVFFIAATIISRLIRLTAHRILLRNETALVDATVVMFLTQFAQISVYIIGLIIFFHIVPALNRLGTALLTGVSVVSVVFGLAAQNTLSNLVAGCTLLLYRPFHIADLIQVATPTGTELGVVERLTLGYTILRTMDDRLVIVPNSLMASQVSLNLNRRQLHFMAVVTVGITDSSHARDVRAALLEAANHEPRIHSVIGCTAQIGDDGTALLSLRAWCDTQEVALQVQRDINEAMRKKFAGQSFVFLAASGT